MNLSDDILDTLSSKTGQPGGPTPVRPEAPPLPPDSVAEEIYTDPKGNVRQAGSTDYNGKFVKLIRNYAERSLYFFARAILRFDRLVPGLHGEMCAFLTKHPPHRKMLLIPRDCFKTTVASKSMPLHKFIQPKEHNIYWPGHDGLETKILLACEVIARAQKHILWMENQMEHNKLLRGLWPEKFWEEPRRQARAWNSNEFYLPREVHIDQSDPSLMGAGVGQAVTGAHFTDIIKDDLISLEAAQFPIVMQRAIEWHIPSRALLEDQEYSNEYIIGCLPADSQVTMGDGTHKPINEVKVGEEVWSAGTDGVLHQRKVKAMIYQGVAETLTIQTEKSSLRATPNHPFLINKSKQVWEWVRADDLEVGDMATSFDPWLSNGLRQERITSITKNEGAEPVYDLTIEGTPSFFANGLAVHNTHWSTDDLYSYIKRNDPTVSCYIRSLVENGKSIFPEEFPNHVIPRMKEEYGPLFPLLYQNNPKDAALVDFQESQIRWYEEVDNEFIFTEDPRDAQLMDTLTAPSKSENADELRPEPRGRRISSLADLEPPDRDTYLRIKYS